MWFVNVQTGLKWDVEGALAAELSASPVYQLCESPNKHPDGKSVLLAEDGAASVASSPSGTIESVATSHASVVTDDASNQTDTNHVEDTAKRQFASPTRKRSK